LARRSKGTTQPPVPEIKQFASREEIERAIAKIGRRLDEVALLKTQSVRYDDQRVKNSESSIRNTILEIYGPSSPEYIEHQWHRIWDGAIVIGGMSEHRLQKGLTDGIASTTAMLLGLVASLEERKRDFEGMRPTVASEEHVQNTQASGQRDAKKVFIIQGRNQAAANELRKFLLSIGLSEWHFEEVSRTFDSQASIYDIVARGVSGTMAVIALFTPDEYACLQSQFRTAHDKGRDLERWQARPNVLYEAGLARGLNSKGTILVSFGLVELPSDLDGIHIIRLTNDPRRRKDLRERLIQAGCAVNSSDNWMTSELGGDFDPELVKPQDGTHGCAG